MFLVVVICHFDLSFRSTTPSISAELELIMFSTTIIIIINDYQLQDHTDDAASEHLMR